MSLTTRCRRLLRSASERVFEGPTLHRALWKRLQFGVRTCWVGNSRYDSSNAPFVFRVCWICMCDIVCGSDMRSVLQIVKSVQKLDVHLNPFRISLT